MLFAHIIKAYSRQQSAKGNELTSISQRKIKTKFRKNSFSAKVFRGKLVSFRPKTGCTSAENRLHFRGKFQFRTCCGKKELTTTVGGRS